MSLLDEKSYRFAVVPIGAIGDVITIAKLLIGGWLETE